MTALAGAPPGLLIDQAARAAVRHQPGNLFVDASAGTGKTTELVERVLDLYRSGRLGPGRLAAITFTAAAAAELRQRVRARLEAAVAEPGGDPEGRVARALAEMDDGAFTTLHAFAQRVLVEFPLEAGLPPQFEVLDEVDEAVDFDRRWNTFLDELLADEYAAVLLRRAVDLGLKLSALRALAEALDGGYERIGALMAPPELPSPDLAPLASTLEKALALRTSCRSPQDKLLEHLESVAAPLLAAVRAADGDEDRVRCLAEAPKLRSKVGAELQWNGCKAAVLGLLEEAQSQLDAELAHQRDAVARGLAARVAGFVLAQAELRHREGRLRYHDLLVLTRRVLTAAPRVRNTLRRRYGALLLDEFQDTDPLQIEIAVLLASSGPADTPWTDARLDEGRLFVVGDPKQSIYRFRRADIAVYERAKRSLGMQHVTLTQNFRCAPGIVDWVNTAFTALLGEGVRDAQPAYSPLVAERAAISAAPAVRCFGTASNARSGAVREDEAAEVASAVRRVLDEAWEVSDPVTGERRPVRHRDIAILVRRHATVRLLERTLEAAGLPYRIESKSLVYATDEVRDLVTLLSAIDDPADEVAVVAALRHPALACDDRALLDWRSAGGAWDPRAPVPAGIPDDQPVAAGLRRLRALHAQRWSHSAGGFVEHVIADLRLLELACARPRPRDRWRRLRFLADQAHAFHDAGGHLRGFLRWVRRQQEADVRVDEFLVDEPDDDAVRISTVHGAKGLEYPVVVLLGLDGDITRLPSNPRLLFGPGGEVGINLGGNLETHGWAEFRRAEAGMHALEEVRLLYVGATRARDHLLVSLHHGRRSRCHAAALLGVEGLDQYWTPLPLADPPLADAPSASSPLRAAGDPTPPPLRGAGGAADPASGSGTAELEAWWAGRGARAAQAARPRVVAVGPAAAQDPPDDAAAPSRKGRGTTPLGRAIHGTLQSVELTGADLETVARAQAAVEGVPGAAAEVAARAAAVLASPAIGAARNAPRHWRELAVGAPVEGMVVEGVVDLLYEAPEGLALVAYPSDPLAPGGTAQRPAPIADTAPLSEAAVLALALECALGRAVARVVIVLGGPDGAQEVTLAGPDLDRARTDARARLRALAG